MRWFKRLRAWILSAGGVANFEKRNYAEAARRLEAACRLDSGLARWEVHAWLLGASYLALGDQQRALQYCLKAYDQLRSRTGKKENGQLDDRMIESLLSTLKDLLRMAGEPDRSAEIDAELQRRRKKSAADSGA